MNTDKEIVDQVLAEGAGAFKTLVLKYERLVFSVVSKIISEPREDIEDVCQDVFISVFKNLKKFKFQSKLSTWIASIAYNMAINHLRKNKSLPLKADIDDFSEATIDTPETMLSIKNEGEFIREQIDNLPINYRTALSLFHLQEMHIDEIATIMKISEGAVRVLLFRARKQLKEMLKLYKSEKV